jgi:thiamine-phosphate diphosphorylase
VTTTPDNNPSNLLPALVGCLEALLASETLPEGLIAGEIGWLDSGLASARPESVHVGRPENRSDAITLIDTARNMLSILEFTGAVEIDSALQLHRALDDANQRVGRTLRRQQAGRIRGLYVIIDPEVTGGREPIDVAKAAINGGARMLQLRDKLRDKGEQMPLAIALRDLCAANDALLIINDHADISAALGPEHVGLHVGQTDLPVADARKILAPGQLLGRSNRDIDLIIESQEMGADHVAFGAIYQSTTKSGGRGPQGPERLRDARAVTKVPLVAIGGINAENVAPVIEAGADAVCVTAAVGLAPEPEAAASRLVEAIRQAGGKI